MVLEIAPIERSRSVDSQAWYFFFSTQKIRDTRAPQSQVFLEKMSIFLVGMRYLSQISTSLFIHWPLLRPGVSFVHA